MRQDKISSIGAQWHFYGWIILVVTIAFPLFYGVVARSAGQGDLKPDLVAISLSAFASSYFIFNSVCALNSPIAGLQTSIPNPVGPRNKAGQQGRSVRPLLAS